MVACLVQTVFTTKKYLKSLLLERETIETRVVYQLISVCEMNEMIVKTVRTFNLFK